MVHGPWTKNTIFQLTLLGTSFGQQIANIHHFEASAARELTFAVTTGDTLRITYCTTLIALWTTNNKTNWVQAHGSDYTLTQLRCQVLETPGQVDHRLTPVEAIPGAPVTGAAATPAEDTTTAAIIKWRSALAGKRSRGRTYVGPVPHGWQQDGYLAATGVTDISAYGTGMTSRYGVGGSSSADVVMTVYSKPFSQGEYGYVVGSGATKTYFYPEDYVGDSNNVVSMAVDPILRTQRRREIGKGS